MRSHCQITNIWNSKCEIQELSFDELAEVWSELEKSFRTFIACTSAAGSLTAAITAAFEFSCPLSKPGLGKSTPWCPKRLCTDRAKLRQLKRKIKLCELSTLTNADIELAKQEMRTIRREYKSKIRLAKRDSWRLFWTEIEGAQPTARMHKLLSKNPANGPGLLRTQSHTSPATTWLPKHPPNTNCWGTQDGYTRWSQGIELTGRLNHSGLPNGVFSALLQHCNDKIIDSLIMIFKASLLRGQIPAVWRRVKIIFIPKPGRPDYTSAKAFRPISLSSFILKTLERLVDRYLRDTNLNVSPLSNKQHAFHSGRSTESALRN